MAQNYMKKSRLFGKNKKYFEECFVISEFIFTFDAKS